MEKELISGNIGRIESSISSIEEKSKECKNALGKIGDSNKFDLSRGKTHIAILSDKIKETGEMLEEFKNNLRDAIILLQRMAAADELSQLQRKVDRWQPENLLTLEMLDKMIDES
ncbi:hypothetical protein KY340_01375 [Candidatus Woesearchaeota archaeon]|nr:hypothetical protein [Candidatus Woesearchaeota archaeon]